MPPKLLAWILLLPALAISYYFAIALPANERAKLQFEKDKYTSEKKEKAARDAKLEEDKTTRETLLGLCTDEADKAYWTYVKLNGKPIPNKPNAYNAPMYVWNTAQKQKTDALMECHRQYGK